MKSNVTTNGHRQIGSRAVPILEKFNVFDRHDVAEKDRPAARAQFRSKLREEVLERLG